MNEGNERLMCYLHETYERNMEPFFALKEKIYSTTIPSIIIHGNGAVEYKYEFTPAQEDILRQIDGAIDDAKARMYHSNKHISNWSR